MSELRFEWDDKKEKANIKRHGVSFDEARTVFYDENAIQFFDTDQLERQTELKNMSIGGTEDERTLRFFQNEGA